MEETIQVDFNAVIHHLTQMCGEKDKNTAILLARAEQAETKNRELQSLIDELNRKPDETPSS